MEDCNTTLIALDVATNRLSWYIAFSILASLVSVIAIVISFKSSRKQLKSNEDWQKKSFAETQKQLKANHDWNRRSFTSTQIRNIANDLMHLRDELDKLTISSKEIIKNNEGLFINFTDRLNQNDQLTPDEVHLWVCEHDDDGKHIPSKSGKNPPCKTSEDGEKIVNNMLEIINVYEQIGIAVKNGIYDEQTIIDAFKNPIKWNYIFYEKYIEHRISEHQDTNFGASFKWMYEYFWINRPEEKRSNADE